MAEGSSKNDDVAPTSGVATPTADTGKRVNASNSTDEKTVAHPHDGSPRSDRGDEADKADEQPPLPFSKARCVALVATLTGASFLNVSCQDNTHPFCPPERS